ncbi:hypothetical protein MRX96_049650 [Rhipicephalus microplus]
MGHQELFLETIKDWGDPDELVNNEDFIVLRLEHSSPSKHILTGDIGINGDTLRSSMSHQAFVTCRAFLGNQRYSAELFAGSKEFLSSTVFLKTAKYVLKNVGTLVLAHNRNSILNIVSALQPSRRSTKRRSRMASILGALKSRNIENSRIISPRPSSGQSCKETRQSSDSRCDHPVTSHRRTRPDSVLAARVEVTKPRDTQIRTCSPGPSTTISASPAVPPSIQARARASHCHGTCAEAVCASEPGSNANVIYCRVQGHQSPQYPA